MATPDGISTEDWNMVHDLAVDLVNAIDEAKNMECRRRLFECLDNLEVKYGPLPSIIATRADFMENDDPEKEAMLHQAHAAAELRADQNNTLYIEHSLAELYIERRNPIDAGTWLARLRESLARGNDPHFSAEHRRLSGELDKRIRRMSEGRGRA